MHRSRARLARAVGRPKPTADVGASPIACQRAVGRQLSVWDCWTRCRPPGLRLRESEPAAPVLYLVMTEGATQTAAGSGAGTEVLRAPEELDLATADGLAAQGCAIAGHARVLLLDLTSLSFCDARGLSAFVRIANQADRAGCRVALIAPQPPVAKVLRIFGLDQRLPVFATTDHALAALTAVPIPA